MTASADHATPSGTPGEAPHVVNEDRFALVPEPLLYDPAICADAVRVYAVLRRHGSDPANCYPSHARIARFIGKAQRSVPGWIRQLEAAGWIDRVPRLTAAGDPDSNGYRVYARALQRGVRAEERGGSAQEGAEGSALESAPKESQSEREQMNESSLFAASAAESAASASEAPDPEQGFDHFWQAWPKRNGKRLGRAEALGLWRRLSIEERRAAWRGAVNYAGASTGGMAGAMDAHRWLRKRLWEEWQDPAVPDAQRRNGRSAALHGPLALLREEREA